MEIKRYQSDYNDRKKTQNDTPLSNETIAKRKKKAPREPEEEKVKGRQERTQSQQHRRYIDER